MTKLETDPRTMDNYWIDMTKAEVVAYVDKLELKIKGLEARIDELEKRFAVRC